MLEDTRHGHGAQEWGANRQETPRDNTREAREHSKLEMRGLWVSEGRELAYECVQGRSQRLGRGRGPWRAGHTVQCQAGEFEGLLPPCMGQGHGLAHTES